MKPGRKLSRENSIVGNVGNIQNIFRVKFLLQVLQEDIRAELTSVTSHTSSTGRDRLTRSAQLKVTSAWYISHVPSHVAVKRQISWRATWSLKQKPKIKHRQSCSFTWRLYRKRKWLFCPATASFTACASSTVPRPPRPQWWHGTAADAPEAWAVRHTNSISASVSVLQEKNKQTSFQWGWILCSVWSEGTD